MDEKYLHKTHVYGRIWEIVIALVLTTAPFVVMLMFNCQIDWNGFLAGFIGTAPIFWTVAVIETLTYIPMLGAGGSYISFVTGNISNLKMPVILNALEQFGVDVKSEEGEVVSTIAAAVSSIVTTLIIFVGVLLLNIPAVKVALSAEVLKPAFNMIIPALFGGLGLVFISKNPKIALVPCVVMVLLFVFVPGLGTSLVGIMAPVGVVIALVTSRILYKKGKL